jgi:hypothetical protein
MEVIANGHTGQLTLTTDDRLELRREGFAARATGHQPFQVRVGQVARFDWKDAGLLTNGYLRIIFVGQNAKETGALNVTQDPTGVLFTRGQQAQFVALRDRLKERLAVVPKEPPPPGVLRLGELIGFYAAQTAKLAATIRAQS